MGLHRAGFDVLGVDIKPQPHYPLRFVQADALEFPLDGFDFIWASPPCQAYSMATRNVGTAHTFPDLVGAVRERLKANGAPYTIENVDGAPLHMPALLCGSMFGLGTGEMWLRRHRYFESSFFVFWPECRHPRGKLSIGVYGNGTPSWHREKLGRNVLGDEWREAMGCPWMTKAELSQAIPPAYAEFIGKAALQTLRVSI